MKNFNRLKFLSALFVALVGVLGVVLVVSQAQAQEIIQEDEQQQEQSVEQTKEQPQEEGATYNYIAQAGDSYTLMARKAVQTYGINSEVSLNEAQIIFAETNLTQLASSPLLNLGQEVQISESVVKEWVESAQNLSEEEQASWGTYASGVNFNTNAVGEVAS